MRLAIHEFTIPSSTNKLWAIAQKYQTWVLGQCNLFLYLANNERRSDTTVITENYSPVYTPVGVSSSISVTLTSKAIMKWTGPTVDHLECLLSGTDVMKLLVTPETFI